MHDELAETHRDEPRSVIDVTEPDGLPGTVEDTAGADPAATVDRGQLLTADDLTDGAIIRRPAQAPEGGWRRTVHRLTGGLVTPGPSRRAIEEARVLARVRAPLTGSRRIVVLSRKGGVGKTTTALLLGHALAAHRSDRVVALDGDPDAGTLGHRMPRAAEATIVDLLESTGEVTGYADVRRFTAHAASRLEVLTGDDDPAVHTALRASEYRQAVGVLQHHYNVLVLDSGTGILDTAARGLIELADQIVVVFTGSLDAARSASLTLDWLEANGHGGLVERAVAVLNRSAPRRQVALHRIERHFWQRCRALVRLPEDEALAAGGRIEFADLAAPTRAAATRLAAAVADDFGTS